MREIQTIEWCDVCWTFSGVRSPSVDSIKGAIDGIHKGKRRELLVCADHRETVEGFRHLFDTYSIALDETPPKVRVVPVKQTAPKAAAVKGTLTATGTAQYPCRAPKCKQVFDKPQQLGAHMRRDHPGLAARQRKR